MLSNLVSRFIVCAWLIGHCGYRCQAIPTAALSISEGTSARTLQQLLAGNDLRTEQICVNLTAPNEADCRVCYEAACAVPAEALQLFGVGDVGKIGKTHQIVHNNGSQPTSTEASVPCRSVTAPATDPGPGCAYVANVQADGCVRCYSRLCLICATDVRSETKSIKEIVTIHALGTFLPTLYPSSTTAVPATQIDLKCPSAFSATPHNVLKFIDSCNQVGTTDNGCGNSCQTAVKPATAVPSLPVVCPVVSAPTTGAAVGCSYEKTLDLNGCISSYDLVCITSVSAAIDLQKVQPTEPTISLITTTGASVTMPSKLMFGQLYKGDMMQFRPRVSLPAATSGRLVICERQSDCFKYREPNEWCMNRDEKRYSWTDKSCFCANDTAVQACIIERLDLQSSTVEWTFCAPKTEFQCDLA